MPIHNFTIAPVAAYDDTVLQAAVNQLASNEMADDATVAALKAVVDAIKPFDDTALKAKNTAQDGEISDLKLSDTVLNTAINVVSSRVDAIPAAQNLTPLNDAITALQGAIGEIRIYTNTAEPWPTDLQPGEIVNYLSASGNLTTLTISALPATLTAIWIAGRKQSAATSVTVKDIRRATARILGNQLIIECVYTEANLIWSTQTTASGVYSSAVQGLPNMREALRRWRFRVQFVLATSTTAAQFLTDAQSSPLVNYVGPNGVTITTEPTLDMLRLTLLGGVEVYSTATLDSARVIPAGTYVSWIVGGELYLIQISALASFTRVMNSQWFDTEFNLPARYDRSFNRTEITSLSLEYKRQDGTVKSVSLTDFATGFANSGFWNGTIDPNGVTRFISTGFGTDVVVVSFNGAGDKLTLAAVVSGSYLQIRKVTVNGQPADWLPIYDPSLLTDGIAAQDNRLTALEATDTRQRYTYRPGNSTALGVTNGFTMGTGTGTISTTTPTAASPARMTLFAAGNVAGNAHGGRMNHAAFFRQWGWQLACMATWVSGSNGQLQVGLTTGGGLAAEPSAVLNQITVGYDSTDANLQLMVNGPTGTATKTDLGIPRGTPITFWLEINCAPGSSPTVKVTNALTKAVIHQSTPSTKIPDLTTALAFSAQCRNTTTTPPTVGLGWLNASTPI